MRLPVLTEEEMNPRQKELAARIAGRRGAVRGPFRVWLHSPEMCERAESLGAFARFDCGLPKHLRELALLMAARNWDAQYSWNAHVHQAIEAGVPEAAVKAIAERREADADFEDDADLAFYRFCREILDDHFVTDATFAAALAHFGPKGLVDTIGALGNFTMLGMCLNTFQVDLQADKEPPFPDIRGYARLAPAPEETRP
jgi:4-carboxymuconolactone decarboxylase